MATTSPPSPPPPAAPPPPQGPPEDVPRAHARGNLPRVLAVGALALVVLVIALLVFAGGGGATYQLMFNESPQLVKGDQVQVGGVPVGSVTDIVLTKDFKARVTIHIESSLAPLHHGTTAQVRVPSLSSVANRYIALSPGPNNYPAYPNGATLPSSVTGEVTDIDELFNTLNPKTRKGLQEFIQGTAEQYEGAGRELGESTEYFGPFLAASDHVFAEIASDQPAFESFLVEGAKAVSTIAAHKQELSELVGHADTTFGAIGSQQTQITEGLDRLSSTIRQGNRTFAELPATFAALKELVDASRPTTGSLTKLLSELRGLVTVATEPVHNFKLTFSRPGANNDLTDLVRALPALAKELSSASPSSVTALKESVPITAFFGPYAPDLTGTLRTFGQAASYYDGNGGYARVSPLLPDFTLGSNETLTPASSPQAALSGLKSGQLRRCPGAATEPAADGSSPFVDGELLSCDPSEVP